MGKAEGIHETSKLRPLPDESGIEVKMTSSRADSVSMLPLTWSGGFDPSTPTGVIWVPPSKVSEL